MNKRNIESIYPLSPMQQGMLFHSIYEPESGVYFEQLTTTLEGDLNIGAFKKAWQQVIDRHSVLRTAFVWKRLDKTLQVVHKEVPLPFEELDWSNVAEADFETQLNTYLVENKAAGFKLTDPPLMRLAVIRRADGHHQFVWSHHHLLMDGWSLPIVIRDVFTFYEANRTGQSIALPPVKPYRDYINWLQNQSEEDAQTFWKKSLSGFTAPTPLGIDVSPNGKLQTTEARFGDIKVLLSGETTAALQALARQHQLTLNTLVQGAWAILLSRYSREEDILFGATVSGRPAELDNVEFMVGLFINTLPVRVNVQPNQKLAAWLKQLQSQQVDMRQFEYSALVQIQSWSDVPRDLPLFESILVFENYPVDTTLREQSTSLKARNIRSMEQTNYPITLVASPGKELFLQIAYDRSRIDDQAAKRLIDHLAVLLQQFPERQDQTLGMLSILTEPEKQQLLLHWNETEAMYPDSTCIHELFEQRVAETPNAPALVFESRVLSYAELNGKANQLARYLQKCGVGREVIVGICMERSADMIIAMLASLKAGGAYVPIDPNYPQDRIEYMINDSQLSVLLTQEQLQASLPATRAMVSLIDAEWDAIAGESSVNLDLTLSEDNLAYVIYTSGSTGRPKGTLLSHKGFSNFITAFIREMGVSQDSRVLQFASISFDASVAEIYLALLSGAALYVARQETLLSVVDLSRYLQEQGITAVSLPPSMLTLLSEQGLPALEAVISAGEACTRDIADRWAQNRRFLNGYGPTEGTVGATWNVIREIPEGVTNISIGKAIQNKKIYILDQNLNPAPVGIAGELHIGGVGLARGYLNRPDLTAEKFIPNPFINKVGERMYRSGDLARYLPDGNIEFLGRIDHQVKIRGFRIELGEIEEVLMTHPVIRTAVVIAREDKPGDKRLVAYVVPDATAGSEPTTSELYSFLKERLPDYMVPSFFMKMESLPLTPNGKINRKALPAPEQDRPELGRAYIAPRTPAEQLVADIMGQVLGLERVGVNDDFFELGGHSLLGVKMQSRIRSVFEVELPLRDLFENPTVAQLANVIEKLKLTDQAFEAPAIAPVPRDGELPLSFSQQRLWFLDQLEPNSPFYNIPTALRLKGNVNMDALQKSLNEICRRHESLRTTFRAVRGKPFQVIADAFELNIESKDMSAVAAAELDAEILQIARADAQKAFDLANGPLLRALLIRVAEDDHVFLFTMHHIISDGWSVGVLIKEVAALYRAYSENSPSPLPALPVQYADFAHWQRNWLQGDMLAAQLDYWRKQLDSRAFVLDLPTDRPRPAVQSFRGAVVSRKLPNELLASLKALSQKEGVSLFMTLLAAFKTLLYRYSGQEHINVGTPHANRNRLETENLIGFFVNTLVLHTDLSNTPTFKDLMQRVKEVAFGAYRYQDMPFETLVEELQPQRDLSHTPIFQVMFVFQNAPMQSLELPGLTFEPIEASSGTAKFDLSLIIGEGGGFSASIEYNTDLFYEATIERMLGHLQTLLESVSDIPEQRIDSIRFMKESEMNTLLNEWNKTKAEFPKDFCMHQWFEALAEKQPNAVAVTYEGSQLTYSELNARANQLSFYLRKQGVKSENLVGICMERSLDMMVAILGTLKAGGAFIPLDPVYPEERLAYMIEDSALSVLLTQKGLAERLKTYHAIVIALDEQWESIAGEESTNLALELDPDNLAYVIYTSGSTGRPKGTMLRHRGWCNLGAAQKRAFGAGPGSRILQFSSLSFDASVWEMVMALLSGATLCLTTRDMLTSGQGLLEVLQRDAITTVTLPPSVLSVVPQAELPNLSTIITAGEACTPDLVSRWAKGRRFFNAYGPTETTVCASMLDVSDNRYTNPPIGRPIDNFQLYVLDSNMQPVSVGVPGELHIGGMGLARGYLKRPDLTADRFVPNPFGTEEGARLYKSGDLVRFLADGAIEFLGRIDHQVKVRGFRIELGEIESVLGDHPDIRDAVVLVREDQPGDKRLVAYVIPENGREFTVAELRAYLRNRVPDYMVPSAFMALTEFPLTPNGKIDKKSLPAPDQSRPELESAYVAPRNEIEEKLAALCGELLHVEKVGVHDNFFELGGHSLLATQFISHIREAFDVELPLRTLFESPTVAGLAEKILISPKIAEGEHAPKIEKESRGAESIDALLMEMENLSDEEVKRLLEQEMNTSESAQ
ncbi:MAG: amino acid adenylation domain-containing protein [Candidatus Zhuqueibacterota bacterium]